ncbi:MAG: 50S ribosomal protein L35 [Verrucomicrobia bacterium]|nr:MAG: 50S ribosomal protein L35 [Verrucomicrobiota bacterium]
MQKTKKSIAKRFKLSGSGKLIRRSPGQRHLMRKKTVKQKRRNSKDKLVAPGQAAQLKKALPHGLR